MADDIRLIITTNANEVTKDVDRLGTSAVNLGTKLNSTNMKGQASGMTAYQKSVKRSSDAVTKHTRDSKALATAQQASGNVAKVAGKRMNGTGMAIQQVGYQTGDFLVQIQSGTNAMVAFGQQATQLVGVLPMVAGNLGLTMSQAIGLSAGLGIAIPLLTAVGAYFMRSGDQAKSLKDSLEDLTSAVETYADATDAAKDSMKGAREEWGYTSDVLQTIVGDLVIISKIDAFKQLGTTVGKLRSDHISGFEGDLENIADLLNLGGWLSAVSEEAISFNSHLRTLENSSNSLGFRLESALNLRQTLLDNVGAADDMEDALEKMSKPQYAFYVQLLSIITEMELMVGVAGDFKDEQDDALKSTEALTDMVKAMRDAIWDKNRTNRQALIDQREELATVRLIQQYGKDSVEVARHKAQQEAIALNLTTANASEYVRLALEARDVNNAIDASADSASNLASALKDAVSAMNALSGFSDSLDKALDVANAKVVALRSGADAAIAGNIAGMRSDLDRKISAAVGSGVDRSIVEGMYGGERDKISELEAALELGKKLTDQQRGSGIKPPTTPEVSNLEKLEEELKLMDDLRGKTEAYIYVREALGDSYETVGQDRIARLEAEYAGVQALIDLDKEREALAGSIGQSIADGFTAMVDGTMSVKDAFRSMARDIIKQLWDIFVVQQIVNATKTFFGIPSVGSVSADGNVFSGGSVVPYANGGVVNGPTFFPMSGGETGLMGEAGPEAIMPLKRGPGGKLGVEASGGGGQSVVVNQSFNFSANGDDTVKKLIAQAAPKIAQMTKSSLLDDRRRGGATKAAFG